MVENQQDVTNIETSMQQKESDLKYIKEEIVDIKENLAENVINIAENSAKIAVLNKTKLEPGIFTAQDCYDVYQMNLPLPGIYTLSSIGTVKCLPDGWTMCKCI